MASVVATTQGPGAHSITELNWAWVFARLKDAPAGRLWGVPRGGAIVAGLTGRAVDSIDEADAIVDDIVDSGATASRYAEYGKPFWALVDKRSFAIGRHVGWVRFPWEHVDATAELEDTVRRQLQWIGENPNRDGLLDTPGRVLRALREMTSGYQTNADELLATTFDVPCDEMIVVREIEFTSLCEHHLLPFTGSVDLCYIPGRVVGLSKLARLVDAYSRRLQVQERLTSQIAETIERCLGARGVGVVVRGRHACMSCRGVRKATAEMVTSATRGILRDNPEARAEFLQLCR